MTELLETIMLICFGISWPISLINNIKAKTAKSMSICFILMIVFGYIAGITAKIMSGKTSLVIVVYVINLLFVLANVPVYFINRKKDNEYDINKGGVSNNDSERYQNY